jgi:hypothetical protein
LARYPSFGGLCPLTFAQSHTWSAAVFVDEFDAGQLKHTPQRFAG